MPRDRPSGTAFTPVTDLGTLQSQVEERYPGVVLESVVQGHVYLEQYAKGVEAHQALANPTPADDRWLGVCHSMLRDRFAAQETLYRAVIRGEEGARIELARVLSFFERNAEATSELAQTDLEKLTVADKVLWFRAQSIQKESDANLKQATDFAEEAWRLVQAIPEFPILAPWVLMRLGRLHAQAGRGQRALWCIERAQQLVEQTDFLQISRSDVLVRLGRFHEAIAALEQLGPPAGSMQEALKYALRGEAYWAMDRIANALHDFDRASDLSLQQEYNSIEMHARLGFAALATYREWYAAAYEHLLRAKMIANDKDEILRCRFRELILLARRGDITFDQARQELETLLTEFGAMGLLQEQGWVRLHLADIYRQLDDRRYLREFDELQALGVALQNRTFLAREWVLLPELRKLALLTHPKIAGRSPAVLEVYTMGQERLVLDGKPVNIRLRRALELVAYFLEHREVSLKRLLLDVFPDEKPRSARSYFHQFRKELHERVPKLRIEFDEASRMYRLTTDMDVLWDVGELRSGRKFGEAGIFLPSSGNEWAQLLDQAIEPQRQEVYRPLVPN